MRNSRLIPLLVLWVISGYASPATKGLPLSEVAGDPSTQIAGHVNAVTGTYSEQQTDILLLGAEPLAFERYYNSSDWTGGYLCDGWAHNFGHWAVVDAEGKWCKITFPHLSGGGTVFHGDKKARDSNGCYSLPREEFTCTLNRADLEVGLTNCGSGEISGRNNLKNTRIRVTPSGSAYATAGDGSVRTLTRAGKYVDKYFPCNLVIRTEKKPSGNQLLYGYYKDTDLTGVATTNAAGKVLNWIELDYGIRKQVNVRTSEGKTIQYRTTHLMLPGEHSKIQGRYRLSEVISPDQPTIWYQYASGFGSEERMIRRLGPDGRYLEVNYYQEGKGRPQSTVGRVSELRAPVGTDATSIATHRISYPSLDATEVRNAHNQKTTYQFTNKRLTQLIHYTGNTEATYAPYSSDRYYWGDQNSVYRSDLVCRALLEGSGAVRSCRHLAYDQAHNVTAETLYGNLSGHSLARPTLGPDGAQLNSSCESVATHYTYSTDGFNLLLTEREENGRTTTYTYQPGTDLLTSQLISDGLQIVSREFHAYNEDAVRVRSITDDGCGTDENDLTGVTVRCIESVQRRLEAPGVGLPLSVQQCYLDLETGTERQLGRNVNHYNKDLRLVQQDHYDADDQLSYSLTWEHDAMGNVTAETNALGQMTQRRFDANGNKIFEQGANNVFATTYVYDFVDRCISQQQVYPDGSKRAHTATYDTLDHKISEVDLMGHETRYTYDEMGRIVQVQLPESEDALGLLTSMITRKEYDIAGNVVASIDGKGNRTEMSYTICGKVAEIRYPDGSTERSVFNRDGTVAHATALNGLDTWYAYDALGNVIRKESREPSGAVVSVTTAAYKGNRLLAQTDANGNTTSYTYDGAGRQTAIIKHDSHTTFTYDALGRRHITRECADDGITQCRVTRVTMDLLGRELEEIVEDGNACPLKVTRYTYDTYGNRTAVSQLTGTDKGPATTVTDYDADHRPVRITDPLGNVTVIEYDDRVLTSHGHRVLQTRTTDALGNQTWVTNNALGQVVEELRKDPWGMVTAKRQHRYDASGNNIEMIETVIVDGVATRDVVMQATYDSMNRNICTLEAVGTAEERVTHQSYNLYGQQEALLLPDGLILHFVYDGAGLLKQYYSSDGSVDYTYGYDPNGNVLQVDDRKESTSTLRTYDGSNRIVFEKLGNDITLRYQYDGFGRVLQLTLPDQSAIRYSYNPVSLETVTRIDTEGKSRYQHVYKDYDLTGHAARGILAGKAGEVSYTTDLMGRPLTMTSAHFSEIIAPQGYDAVGNLLEKEVLNTSGKTHCHYQYDSLYQLIHESGFAQHQYRYDSLNNRLAKDSDSYRVNALNELQQAGSTSYRYDRRGCRIAEEGDGRNVSYRYDALNRLIEVETADKRLVYTYDSFNRRLSATTLMKSQKSGKSTTVNRQRFVYVGQDEIGAIDDSGQLVELRLLGTGRGAEIGATVAIEIGRTVYAALSDSSGHIVALINASDGAFAEGYRYSAFGEVILFNDFWWPFNSRRVGNPWQFSSKRVDKETGFVLFGRRYYDPALGRWITPDPLGFKAGPNLYAFVMNNPLTHFDLYGLLAHTQGDNASRSARAYRRPPSPAAANRQRLAGFARWVGELPGRAVGAVGRHFVPIPVVREATMGVGNVIRARPFWGCPHCQEQPSHYAPEGGQELAPNRRLSAGNGILTSPEEARQTFDDLSKANGNAIVHGGYSSSCGLVLDLAESAALMLGFNTPAVYSQAAIWKGLFKDMGEQGFPDGRIRHIAHSQGGQIAWAARKLMTPAELSRIDVETYGSAKIIPEGVFGSAINFISNWDAIPAIASPIDYTRARMGLIPNVVFVDGGGIPFCDHSWGRESYKGAMKFQNIEYIEKIKRSRL